jgi:hypothetical protein
VTQLRKTRPVTPEQRADVIRVLKDGGMTYRGGALAVQRIVEGS